jgi:hypothetical protein
MLAARPAPADPVGKEVASQDTQQPVDQTSLGSDKAQPAPNVPQFEPGSEAEWEAFMDATQTVITLQAGEPLTQAQVDEIHFYDEYIRRDEERSIDAFNKGWQAGIAKGGGAEVAKLIEDLDTAKMSLMSEKAVGKAIRANQDLRIADLLSALGTALAWVNHWKDDLASDLKPTPSSLASCEATIKAALPAPPPEKALGLAQVEEARPAPDANPSPGPTSNPSQLPRDGGEHG